MQRHGHLESGQLLPRIIMQFPGDTLLLVFACAVNLDRQFARTFELGEPHALDHIARDLGKAAQLAGCITDCRNDHACREPRAVAAYTPALVLHTSLCDGDDEFPVRFAGRDVFWRIEDRKTPPNDLVRRVPLDLLRAVILGSNVTRRAEHENRIIRNGFDQQIGNAPQSGCWTR